MLVPELNARGGSFISVCFAKVNSALITSPSLPTRKASGGSDDGGDYRGGEKYIKRDHLSANVKLCSSMFAGGSIPFPILFQSNSSQHLRRPHTGIPIFHLL